jgi:hypothetical protein
VNIEAQSLVPISLTTQDPVESKLSLHSWSFTAIAIALVMVMPLLLRGRRARVRTTVQLTRQAWIGIASNCGLNDEQRNVIESLSIHAGVDPCVIALCPSQLERAALISAGQMNRAVLEQAAAKLHPGVELETKPSGRPSVRRRSLIGLNVSA